MKKYTIKKEKIIKEDGRYLIYYNFLKKTKEQKTAFKKINKTPLIKQFKKLA